MASCACVVVVVGIVIGLKRASGALVVGPTNVWMLQMAVALAALRLDKRDSVMPMSAVQPRVAFVKHSMTLCNKLTIIHRHNLCKKNCSVYIQCKGDIVVVDIKQHKSQFKNSNFTITQSAKFL